ncbi:MAG: 50S ribosomal protein L3 [Planctomycetes bacterium]|nr:50S ribosomal protein L3 [Planctomycetota bacterium]
MVVGLLARKLRMTQLYDEAGRVVPVTVVTAGPCDVVQVKTPERDGYTAVQLGFGDVRDKVLTKPVRGHFAAVGVRPRRRLREFPLRPGAAPKVGERVTVGMFEVGKKVDVVGIIKGRGFQGTVKRHGFRQAPNTHGDMKGRAPGSAGMHTDPSRILPGKRYPGQYGNTRQTMKNLQVVRVEAERNLLYLRGAVPGPTGGIVMVRDAKTAVKRKRGKKKYG